MPLGDDLLYRELAYEAISADPRRRIYMSGRRSPNSTWSWRMARSRTRMPAIPSTRSPPDSSAAETSTCPRQHRSVPLEASSTSRPAGRAHRVGRLDQAPQDESATRPRRPGCDETSSEGGRDEAFVAQLESRKRTRKERSEPDAAVDDGQRVGGVQGQGPMRTSRGAGHRSMRTAGLIAGRSSWLG